MLMADRCLLYYITTEVSFAATNTPAVAPCSLRSPKLQVQASTISSSAKKI